MNAEYVNILSMQLHKEPLSRKNKCVLYNNVT